MKTEFLRFTGITARPSLRQSLASMLGEPVAVSIPPTAAAQRRASTTLARVLCPMRRNAMPKENASEHALRVALDRLIDAAPAELVSEQTAPLRLPATGTTKNPSNRANDRQSRAY